MEINEYLRLCARTVEDLAPVIGPAYRGMIMTHDRAGAWDQAIPMLVGAISEEGVAIPSAQKENLRRLLVHMRAPLTYLEQIRTTD
ncbi:hypothetical protein Afil01_25800 [Actinorhabdospora filicis]|uniref:Uncharacterized protein n=1 Tax=Actinorhabdospora filicis TaxID=1785913 RepID=A0A9W6SKQ3_9ACTN|nr:hypothetical protein [Actinorhabdospora filicis]GLZ77773.1 hypothetical protein Afil01_25800 [Actinorhabdospora filicis]